MYRILCWAFVGWFVLVPHSLAKELLFRNMAIYDLIGSANTDNRTWSKNTFTTAFGEGKFLAWNYLGLCVEPKAWSDAHPGAFGLDPLPTGGILYWIGGSKSQDISCPLGGNNRIGKATSSTVIVDGNTVDLTGNLSYKMVSPVGADVSPGEIIRQRAKIAISDYGCVVLYYETQIFNLGIRNIITYRNSAQTTCKFY
jgi:hypothetical protein